MLEPIKNHPALLHSKNKHKTLIITDLHIGWEINLIQKGIHVPSQMPKIRQKLLQLIDSTNPDTLIILGDIKHTVAKAESGEWHDIPEFFKSIKTKINDIQIVRGNHDGNLEPLLPPHIKLHPSTGIALNTVGLFHGHTWPSRKLLKCTTLIMGHAHPTIAFHDPLGFQITTPAWIKVQCNNEQLKDAFLKSKHIKMRTRKSVDMKPNVQQFLIMPCFNDFFGGRPMNKKSERKNYVGPVLRSQAINIDKADAYLLDWTYLGTIEQLKALV